ncbi:phospholipase D-like domain-containing protein [Flavisolibacter nicotianae]|uniref:phospholipase D-like domain-containing protein n=1 Tax=Flavisolibacter nicotianae TaxID=2364882 RepID=UPI000EAF3731|nr:phospholipase D-like domain-containing protein [Flavisolibacter nicotianae]
METNFLSKMQWGRPADRFSRKNIVSLVKGGAPFFSKLEELIARAEYSIHLQTYIFGADATGKSVATQLMAAAKRGVSVYLMADGYASRSLPKDFIHQLENAGVNFRFFEPLFRGDDFYFGRRLHHKVMVADAKFALVSGSNIADRYNDLPGQPAWFDMGLLIEGDSVLELYDICTKIWERDKTKKNVLRKKLLNIFNYISADDAVGVRVLQNDWVRRKLEIYFGYHKLFKESKKSIVIVCSYFLPGISLRNRLSKAVKRGVDVKVILANTSDVALTKHAERYLYRWMLRNGITVYEYLPTVLHAKVAVVDNEFLMLGSYNINDLSAQVSVELNMLVKDSELATELGAEIDNMIATKCVKIDASDDSLRLFTLRQLWQFICFHALRFLLTLGTFYLKQEE